MKNPVRVIVFGLLFLGASSALLVQYYGGALMNDFAVRGDQMLPHPTARVVSAKCKRYEFLISACSIEYDDRFVVPTRSKTIEAVHTLNYLMFGSAAGERATLLRPASRPDIVTTPTGLAHLNNRAVTLVTLVGLSLLTMLALVGKAMTLSARTTPPQMPATSAGSNSDAARIDQMIARHRPSAVSPSGYSGSAVQPGSSPGFGRRGLKR